MLFFVLSLKYTVIIMFFLPKLKITIELRFTTCIFVIQAMLLGGSFCFGIIYIYIYIYIYLSIYLYLDTHIRTCTCIPERTDICARRKGKTICAR